MPYELIDSPAWQELSGIEVKIYLQLRRQSNGYNEQSLKLPYAQIKHAPHTVSQAVDHLERMGLIDVRERGGLFRQPSIYGLSNDWRLYKRSSPMATSIRGVQKVKLELNPTGADAASNGEATAQQSEADNVKG